MLIREFWSVSNNEADPITIGHDMYFHGTAVITWGHFLRIRTSVSWQNIENPFNGNAQRTSRLWLKVEKCEIREIRNVLIFGAGAYFRRFTPVSA